MCRSTPATQWGGKKPPGVEDLSFVAVKHCRSRTVATLSPAQILASGTLDKHQSNCLRRMYYENACDMVKYNTDFADVRVK